MPILAGALYVRKYFDQDSKKHALEMVHYIKEAFAESLRELDWMDEKTCQSALDKAEAMTLHIGYPDEILDDKRLAKYYSEVLDASVSNHIALAICFHFVASSERRGVSSVGS